MSTDGHSILFVVAPLLLALIPAFIADRRGRSFVRWWVLGLLLIVALPAALLLTRDPHQPGRTRFSMWAVVAGIVLIPIGGALLVGGIGGSWLGSSSWQGCQAGDDFACWSPQIAGIQGLAAIVGGPVLIGVTLVERAKARPPRTLRHFPG